MAFSKKGYRKIVVQGKTFLWRVRKKVSHEEGHGDQLPIPVQHDAGGQLLFLLIGYSRAGYKQTAEGIEVGDRTFSITPSIIKEKIEMAIELGWDFGSQGKPIALVDGKLSSDIRWSKVS